MKHYSTYQSQFIEMFEGDKYPRISLDAIADEWLKGQAFKKDEICENGDKHCIHYGELFTKYGPVIKEVVSKTSVELKKPSKNGDILFPASDVTPNGLARCSMLPYDNVVLGGDIIVLRPKEGYSPAYLSYAINQQTTQLLARVNGGLVKHLSAKGLKTIEIPIPSKEKQEEYIRIAEQADKSKFTSLKSQFIEMFGDQNANDKGWPESLVKDEFKLSMGKTPARNNPECWDNGTNKWVSISDMSSYTRYTGDTSEYITDYAIADSGIKAVPKGTIIMSFKLSIGRTAITSEDIYTNEAIMAFAGFDENKFNIDFLHFLIANKNWLLGAKQAVKGQTLNKESIGNAKIIIPPIETQEEFASIYNQADKSKYLS